MTNRLELKWQVNGDIDEQRYYCSETPIDLENLPTPKAVLTGDIREYIDVNIEVGKTYSVAISSVKDNVEKLSDLKLVDSSIDYDPHWSNVVSLLSFDTNFDDKKGPIWVNSNISFGQDVKKFGVASLFRDTPGSTLSTERTNDFNWWLFDEYTIEMWAFQKKSSYTPSTPTRSDMLCCSDNNLIYEWGFGINERNKLSFNYWSSSANHSIECTSLLNDNKFHHIAMCLKDQTIKLFVDGIKEAEALVVGYFQTYNAQIRIGNSSGYQSHQFYIDEMRITKGVARYTGDFTPPSIPFHTAP